MIDVYFYEAFEEEASSLKSVIENRFTFDITDKTIQESGHKNPKARLISIRTQSIIPSEWANQLDGILSRSTGYDHLKKHLDLIRKPLVCGYLEEYATHAVAEHAILLTMALLRRLPQQISQFKQFDRDGLTGIESTGKRLLIVGVGRIGGEIVKIATALGMTVRGVDIVRRHSNVFYVTIEEGIPWADCVICAMNLNSENHGYFSYNLMKKAQPGVVFVNIARGEHAPLLDLQRLIDEGHIGGIGLDVFEDEPNIATAIRTETTGLHPLAQSLEKLMKDPRVLLTPNNAFNTREAVQRKSEFSINEILYFLKTKDFHCRVI